MAFKFTKDGKQRPPIGALDPAPDALLVRVAAAVMAALAVFGDQALTALHYFLLHVARACDVTGAFPFLSAGNTAQDVVIGKIAACIQFHSTGDPMTDDIFNNAFTNTEANMFAKTVPPAVTPSPAPREPTVELDSLDDLIDRKLKQATAHLYPPHPAANSSSSSNANATNEAAMHFMIPTRVSHGQGHVSDLPGIPEALFSAQFDPYRWTTTEKKINILMREALSEMVFLMEDHMRFKNWCAYERRKLSPLEYALFNSGSNQARIEMCVSVKLANPALMALLIAARTPGSDVLQLESYMNGSASIPSQPLFGGYKAPTSMKSNTNNEQGGGGNSKETRIREAKAKADKAEKALAAATAFAAKSAKELKNISE